MIDKKEFSGIRAELEKSEKQREALIQESRETIRLSKLIIYALLREDSKKAAALAKQIKSKVKKLPPNNGLTGMRNVALQEYTEAMAFFSFVKTGKIPTRKQLGVDTGNYLGGLSDLTGEMVRMAVKLAINKKFKEVLKVKSVVEEIYGEFLNLNLRGGELRKKSDQIKWNLNKLEDMAYNISKNE